MYWWPSSTKWLLGSTCCASQVRSLIVSIKVLAEVHDILAAAATRQSKVADQSKINTSKRIELNETTSNAALGNNDELLHPEESTQPIDEPAITEKHILPQVEKAATKVVDEDADTAFAVWCFLETLYSIRLLNEDAFSEYVRGEKNSLFAGITAEAGFGLMRKHWEAFARTQTKLANYWDVVAFLGVTMLQEPGSDWLFLPGNESKSKRPKSSFDPSQLICIPAPRVSNKFQSKYEAFLDVLNGRTTPESTRHFVVNSMPSRAFGDLMFDPLCKLRLHIERPGQVVPGLFHTKDEFTEGLSTAAKGDSFPATWLVIACQTYMNIYDMLGGKMSVGDNAVRYCRGRSLHIITPPRAEGKSFPSNLPGFALSSNQDKEAAARFEYKINDDLAILSVAHLYKAFGHFGLMAELWASMDLFLSHHVGTLLGSPIKQQIVDDLDV